MHLKWMVVFEEKQLNFLKALIYVTKKETIDIFLIYFYLIFQMQGTVGMEIQNLETKLLVMYEENQNRSLA